MPLPERGATDRGFRQQLLERLKNGARREGVDPRRLQQRVAFERLLTRLREAIAQRLPVDDRFRFEAGGTTADLQGAPGGGLRVRIVTRVAGVEFATFAVDLASGDKMIGAPDTIVGSDLLAFAKIAPVRFPVYPVTQHLGLGEPGRPRPTPSWALTGGWSPFPNPLRTGLRPGTPSGEAARLHAAAGARQHAHQ